MFAYRYCLDQTVIKPLLLKGIIQKQLATPTFTFRLFWFLAVLFGCKLNLQVASLKGSYFSTKRLDSGPAG
jgi:hypothetical protein